MKNTIKKILESESMYPLIVTAVVTGIVGAALYAVQIESNNAWRGYKKLYPETPLTKSEFFALKPNLN